MVVMMMIMMMMMMMILIMRRMTMRITILNNDDDDGDDYGNRDGDDNRLRAVSLFLENPWERTQKKESVRG